MHSKPYSHYSNDDMNRILDYIYAKTEISRFKYKILEYENDLNILTTQKYYVSANFSGTTSLLVFVKIMDRFYSCLVDRKTLSYNRQQVNINSVKITPVNIRLDNTIYNGTIMDGIHVYNKRTNTNVFIMTDIYLFRGQDMTNDMIHHKIMNVSSYINANLKDRNNSGNNINIVVNKLYELSEIDQLKETMEKVGGYDMKGLVFYPDISGTKLIFLDNNKIVSKPKETPQITHVENQTIEMKEPPKIKEVQNKKKTKYRYICKSNEDIYAILEIRKTEQPDVYYVSCAQKENIEGKNIIKIIRLGIALIPSKDTSKLCKSLFQNRQNNKMLMKCKFDQDKNKWIPIEENKTSKLPTLLSDIEKEMDLIMESDSDDD